MNVVVVLNMKSATSLAHLDYVDPKSVEKTDTQHYAT